MGAGGGLTEDGFLAGRLRILQPRDGYRAATDPVLLAAAVPARTGDRILELGCGVGVASLCLAARVPGLVLTGLELQETYAALARENAARNRVAFEVLAGDIAVPPRALGAQAFDHVIANPPYFAPGSGTPASDRGRESAQREMTPLSVWVDLALRRLKPGGWLTVIQAAERLPDLLAALGGRAGAIAVLPVAPRADRPAGRVLMRARKGARGPFALMPPLVIHAGDRHETDGDDYTEIARHVLRDLGAIEFGPGPGA